MKSFQHLTTVIALMLLASHQAVAAPASENQARNQIGVPPNAVVISSDGNIYVEPDGTTVVENSPTGGDLAESINNNVDNQIATAFGNITSADDEPTSGDLAESITNNVDKQIAAAFGNVPSAADDVDA